jgi:putative transposase
MTHDSTDFKGGHHVVIALQPNLPSRLFHQGSQTLSHTRIRSRRSPIPAGTVKGLGGIPLIVNGTEDHVHLLAKLNQNHKLKDVLREIKANSSGWIHREFPALGEFAWQAGYGAFTVSASQKDTVQAYVENQEKHHEARTFKEEYVALLKAHKVEYDERYMWD